MSRALILPTPGDPVMLAFWFKQFVRWHNKVDRLYLVVNTPSSEFHTIIEKLIKGLGDVRDKITYIRVDEQIAHGDAINRALDEMQEEYLMLCEDDCFIFDGTAIDLIFSYIESGSYDVVGSSRGSCSMEIVEAARRRWGDHYWGLYGPNFWPCMFASSKETLLQTNRDFCSHNWIRGERIEALDHVVEEDVCAGDTFVWASLQLRELVGEDRIQYVDQNHAGPDDLQFEKDYVGLFDRKNKPQYIHVGSLSSGVHGALRDSRNRPLASRLLQEGQDTINFEYKPIANMEKLEWERRVAWWYLCLNYSKHIDLDFWELYLEALQRLTDGFDLDGMRIQKMMGIYRRLFKKHIV